MNQFKSKLRLHQRAICSRVLAHDGTGEATRCFPIRRRRSGGSGATYFATQCRAISPQFETLILGGKGAATWQALIGHALSGQNWSTDLNLVKSVQHVVAVGPKKWRCTQKHKSSSLHVPHLSSIQEEIWTLEAKAEKHAHIAVHSAAWRDSAHLEAQHGSTSHAHSLHGPAKRNGVTGCKSRIVQVAWKEREHAVAHENVPAKAWVHTEKSSLLERGIDDGDSFLQSSKAWEQLGFGQEKMLQHVELENAATRPMSKTTARPEGRGHVHGQREWKVMADDTLVEEAGLILLKRCTQASRIFGSTAGKKNHTAEEDARPGRRARSSSQAERTLVQKAKRTFVHLAKRTLVEMRSVDARQEKWTLVHFQ
ncbi:hypothetical protein LR48_Vigan07g191300 [Vigna angularis]|uniref:Uncharacterized protein n=1 Tax=Phaseolus angularis TaxID=3914 RepID=A0A0L9V0A3_PHAAN|nr:hypothetical protein LR48_Vigan07g191300 [Vigna angularis]